MPEKTRDQLIAELEALKEEKRLKEELPHLYAFPDYKFAKEFKSSTNRMRILCSANQLGKSSVLICDTIEKACNKKNYKKFFPNRKPKVGWYIYPTKDKILEECTTKWPEFLPRGSAKESGPYSWKWCKVGGNKAIQFIEADVLVIFKPWGADLQSGTVDFINCDEEIPADIYPELSMRASRYNGMFAMVFTATLNQPFWFDAIERIGTKKERFPEAAKWQISMERDCEFYADGTPSPWTKEAVQAQKNRCGSETEINRRVHGRFVTEVGLKYAAFDAERNIKEQPPSRKLDSWLWYSGVDLGSGGGNHPGAITVIAVKPDYTFAVIKRMWRGSDNKTVTQADILEVYKRLTSDLTMTGEYYDFAGKDFGTLADRSGFNFQKAQKGYEYDMINVLFKNQMLEIDAECDYIDELTYELKTLKVDTPKTKAKDDQIDSVRYATSSLPWDISSIKSEALIKLLRPKQIKMDTSRRVQIVAPSVFEPDGLDAEIDELNELAGGFF